MTNSLYPTLCVCVSVRGGWRRAGHCNTLEANRIDVLTHLRPSGIKLCRCAPRAMVFFFLFNDCGKCCIIINTHTHTHAQLFNLLLHSIENASNASHQPLLLLLLLQLLHLLLRVLLRLTFLALAFFSFTNVNG